MRLTLISLTLISLTMTAAFSALAAKDLKPQTETAIKQIQPQMLQWRRHFHQYPELSNREVNTAKKVAAHLTSLGLEVQTGLAHHGVLAVLKGAKPGPVIALRADMDALPVTEQVDLPFASKVRSTFNGQEVGVMHACGHDAHTAILMATASILSGMKSELSGTVLFVFQPAEEGPPAGEEGGAKLMLKDGVFARYKPDAIFGLHVWPAPAGQLQVKSEGIMAAADSFNITVKGKQVHGSSPWRGVDPVAVTGQLISALHQIPARQLDVTKAPAVLSIGQVHGGIRWNIIPDDVKLEGTIRTFDPEMRQQLLEKMQRTSEHIAAASGATAEFHNHSFAAVTWNDPELTAWAMPSLQWAAGKAGVAAVKPITGSEDFSYFQQQVPGVFFFLGISAENTSVEQTAPNHSPLFQVNEQALENGVRALTALTLDYMATPLAKKSH